MIIVMNREATQEDADQILETIKAAGLKPLCMPGSERIVLGALGDERVLDALQLESHPLVESVKPVLAPYKLVSRELKTEDTVIDLGHGVRVGGGSFTVIAGPCSIESLEQLKTTAEAVKEAGAHGLRGGAFKPRTSPYSFQGLGVEGLKILQEVSDALDMPTFTELVEVADLEAVEEHAHVFQIGARNMQNFRLLSAVGERRMPVLLKRGMSATLNELLLAAEYIVSAGNPNVIICERGIRTFEPATRNTLDLNAVPFIKQRSHLPVFVDPSHGTGLRELITPMTCAAIACGADGVIVEAHHDPARALSDGHQSLSPAGFAELMKRIRPFVTAAGKEMG